MIYEFECPECKIQEEKVIPIQIYSQEKNNQRCGKCNAIMTRVFTPIGLTEYKGKGFYDTDSRGIGYR